MCGISCIVSARGCEDLKVSIERMNETVTHRGPDGSGVAVFRNCVALGHRRLSIIDLTEGGHQPMSFGAHHLTFNGEIYNYREIRAELENLGENFQSQSDTEVLLRALVRWGIEAVERLRGMFAFSYYDESSGQVYLVRDRFGQKPLVYANFEDKFFAASEVKQILAGAKETPSLNADMVTRFLAFGALNGTTETFFQGITEVPPGNYLKVDVRTLKKELVRWYDLSQVVKPCSLRYEDARANVRELFLQAVRRRHIADVKVGACLSGGIDSSCIVSASASLFPDQVLQTITSFSKESGFDERPFSRQVVEKFSIESIEIEPNTRRVFETDMLIDLAYYQDQPVKSGSQLNEWSVFKAAKENDLTVMLDGQGSDEYFGGYGEFWFSAQYELLRNARFGDFWEGIRSRADAQSTTTATVMKRFAMTAYRQHRILGQPDWLKIQPAESVEWRNPLQPFDKLSLEQIAVSSIPYQVHSEDRASMKWSIESRLPFLDHDLVEFVLGLPTNYKVCRGRQKAILRDAVPELPAGVSGRKDKVGFASPDAISLENNIGSVRDTLRAACDRTAQFVDPQLVERSFNQFCKKQSAYDSTFLRIISLDAFLLAFDLSS